MVVVGEFVELRVGACSSFMWRRQKLKGHKLWWSSRTGGDGERAQSPDLPSQLKDDASL